MGLKRARQMHSMHGASMTEEEGGGTEEKQVLQVRHSFLDIHRVCRVHTSFFDHTFSSSSLCFCRRATSSSEVIEALFFICTFSTGRPSPPSSRPLAPSGALRDLACPEAEAVCSGCPWCGAGAAEPRRAEC